MAQIRQSRPDYGLGLSHFLDSSLEPKDVQTKPSDFMCVSGKTLEVFPSSLGSGEAIEHSPTLLNHDVELNTD